MAHASPETPRLPKAYAPETILTLDEVAEWLCVHRRTAERLGIKRIAIGPHTRRYLAKHVLEYLETKGAA